LAEIIYLLWCWQHPRQKQQVAGLTLNNHLKFLTVGTFLNADDEPESILGAISLRPKRRWFEVEISAIDEDLLIRPIGKQGFSQ
jgi:hypothetical protein